MAKTPVLVVLLLEALHFHALRGEAYRRVIIRCAETLEDRQNLLDEAESLCLDTRLQAEVASLFEPLRHQMEKDFDAAEIRRLLATIKPTDPVN